MKTFNKEKAKAAFNAIKKITSKTHKKVFELSPLLKTTVSYDVVWNEYNGLDYEIDSEKIVCSKELKKLLEKLDVCAERLLEDYQYEDEINFQSDNVLINKLIEESGIDPAWYGSYCDYNNFEEWYKDVLENEEESQTVKSNTIQLTRDYNAVVDKKKKVVKVGCQTIPIEKVEEILKIYNS